ncbi:hypothetical protein HDU77_011606, partial [Chytriomyces hyalinus]
METPNKASSILLERLRKDTENTDVDLVFEGGVVLTAHAAVLKSASDYYKEALSTKWAHGKDAKESVESGIRNAGLKCACNGRQLSAKSTGKKFTLNHPNIRVETAKIMLDFLYLGDVVIPPSLIPSVMGFADEILVVSLVQKEVETLLLYEPVEPLDRWRILIAWSKACQDAEGDLSLESKLPENFPIEVASKLIEPLLIVVELIKIPATNSNLLEPFQVLFPKLARDMLAFHLKGTTRSGGNQWKATHQNLMEIMRAIKPYLPNYFCSHNAASEPVLLFHGKPGTSIE